MPYTAGSIASYLEKMNKDYYGRRTWSQQFGGIDLAKQMSIEGLKTDFGKAIGSAYDSSLRNQNIIAASNLIQGNKDLALEQNQQALQDAYDSYLKNYKLGVQDIQSAAIQQQSIVNQNLLKQGEMFSRYATSHIDYLYDLWNKYENGEITGEFFNDPKFANYVTNQYDELGNIIVDENGVPEKTIIGRGDLQNILFDPKGHLTLTGRAFFEQMEYDELLRGNSFSDYLSQADNELYQWALSENPYNYAPNKYGENTMTGTFREMTGRLSTDEVFEGAEAFAGMTEGAMRQTFNQTMTTLDNLREAYISGDETAMNESVAEFSAEITSLIEAYGLEKDLLTELNSNGYEYESVDDFLTDVANSYKEGKVDAESTNAWKYVGEYGTAGAASGAAIGTAATPIGTAAGGIVGAIIGTTTGVLASIEDYNNKSKNAENKNYELRMEIESNYTNLVSALVNTAANKRRQIETEFYGKETSAGGVIQGYDPLTSKHSSYYNYGLNDGTTASFISASTLKDNVSDKTGDYFTVKVSMFDYNLQVGNKTMDVNTVKQLSKKVYDSMGRPLQTGDLFYYKDRLWVVSDKGTVRSVQNRFGDDGYAALLSSIEKTIE